jgi:circadian clock protein KaiC
VSPRVSSGSERIDLVLGGGFPAHGINLLIGRPGSGKTILAQQYVFHNASPERPAIYLSTVSEPLEKILRYGDSLTFFDRLAVGSSVLYDELGGCVNEDGLPGVLDRVTSMLRERRPGMMVIDSFKALRSYAANEGDFRRFLHEMAGRLSAFPVTSFWVGEYEGTEPLEAPEFAVADAIVLLSSQRTAEREVRFLQVLKLRGSGFLSGRHAYRLSADGLELFPRLADPVDTNDYGSSPARISSGVAPLDVMLADGYIAGASTLVAGPSGSGKTLLCLHFLMAGARAGQPGLIATMQENPIQLERTLNGYNWTLKEPGIEMLYRTPVDLYLDQWVYDLLATIERTGAQRVMIDSLGDLRATAGDELRFREYMYSLLQRCAHKGVSVMMTQEVPELFGVTRLSEYGISHLSDNVVLLQFLLGDSQVRRAITVIKTRSSGHDSLIRQFDITSDGFVLGEHFSPSPSPS